MAQASSAQREPSMEEILASIRRIIEDSDVERKREEETSPGALAPAANDAVDAGKGVEAFRAEIQGESEDVTDAAPAELPHDEVLAAEAAAQQPYSTIAPEFLEEQPSLRQSGPDDTVEELEFPEDAFDDLDVPGPAAADVPKASEAVSEWVSRPPLISEQAGRQVAAAFGELEAFAASRRRSFDEMAEEMLRPMLQDWLDNNLPHLVERLVREEIERIARG